jgi:hypothetical protein
MNKWYKYFGHALTIIFVMVVTMDVYAKEQEMIQTACDSNGFNYIVGTQTFGVKYQFTNESKLVETAESIYKMGSNSIKFLLGNGPALNESYGITLNEDIKSCTDLITKEPSYKQVFEMPFKYYFFWAYPVVPIKWEDGLTRDEKQKLYDEFYELSCYLLTHFNGSGKVFFLGNWEGDWSLMGLPYVASREPNSIAISSMIEWLNVRQQAVNDARKKIKHKNVNIYHYVEVNLVKKGMKGEVSLTTHVLPKTDVDFVSYSCYECLDVVYRKCSQTVGAIDANTIAEMQNTLRQALSFIEKKHKGSKSGQKRVFIGEYGFPLKLAKTEERQDVLSRVFMQTMIEWGSPFIFCWQLYENEYENGAPVGWAMIDENGHKNKIYTTHKEFLTAAKEYVRNFCKQQNRYPSDAEFRKASIEIIKNCK